MSGNKFKFLALPKFSCNRGRKIVEEDNDVLFDFDLRRAKSCEAGLDRRCSSGSCTSFISLRNNGKGDGRQRKFSAVAKNVRNVLSFFKRKTSETPIPPLEEIKSWSRSITNLLYDKYGLMLFKSFLCSEYSEENIDFWIACEEYKQIKGKNFSVRAEKLYGDYVTVHAPKEVNLDSKTRMETMQALPYADQNTFDAAQEKIQSLMEKDSYTRFLRSKVYTTLLSSGSSSAA